MPNQDIKSNGLAGLIDELTKMSTLPFNSEEVLIPLICDHESAYQIVRSMLGNGNAATTALGFIHDAQRLLANPSPEAWLNLYKKYLKPTEVPFAGFTREANISSTGEMTNVAQVKLFEILGCNSMESESKLTDDQIKNAFTPSKLEAIKVFLTKANEAQLAMFSATQQGPHVEPLKALRAIFDAQKSIPENNPKAQLEQSISAIEQNPSKNQFNKELLNQLQLQLENEKKFIKSPLLFAIGQHAAYSADKKNKDTRDNAADYFRRILIGDEFTNETKLNACKFLRQHPNFTKNSELKEILKVTEQLIKQESAKQNKADTNTASTEAAPDPAVDEKKETRARKSLSDRFSKFCRETKNALTPKNSAPTNDESTKLFNLVQSFKNQVRACNAIDLTGVKTGNIEEYLNNKIVENAKRCDLRAKELTDMIQNANIDKASKEILQKMVALEREKANRVVFEIEHKSNPTASARLAT